jgi:hypothetical protein
LESDLSFPLVAARIKTQARHLLARFRHLLVLAMSHVSDGEAEAFKSCLSEILSSVADSSPVPYRSGVTCVDTSLLSSRLL